MIVAKYTAVYPFQADWRNFLQWPTVTYYMAHSRKCDYQRSPYLHNYARREVYTSYFEYWIHDMQPSRKAYRHCRAKDVILASLRHMGIIEEDSAPRETHPKKSQLFQIFRRARDLLAIAMHSAMPSVD